MSKTARRRVNIGSDVESEHRDEGQLVAAAQADRAAFGVLYDSYFNEIYHYIARRVGSREVAEDIAGATWEHALAAIERYEIRGLPFAAWLYRIAGNLVANHHRRLAVRIEVPFDHADVDPNTEAGDRAIERQAVFDALAVLSESDQEILSLCYFAGLSTQEISDILGCSAQAVHKRLHRARTRFRAHFQGPVRE